MKKVFYLFLLFSLSLFAKDFKVATYNVENLFDLHYDKTEYKEYIPNSKTWNKKAFYTKIKNISQVIQDLDADILALQEIESQKALDAIVAKNPSYTHSQFLKKRTSSVGVAIMSKYPIINSKKIEVNNRDKYARDILKVVIKIQNKNLILYVNHWRSKRAKESKRIVYATSLKKELETLGRNEDYIILGDLNSNYNEYLTFKYDKKLNDTFGITGINQILNTTKKENFISKKDIVEFDDIVHYNLWLELDKNERYSAKFRNEKNTPDSIILSKGLFDKANISYINNSFAVFKPKYLYKSKKIVRWNRYKYSGYSDHLPIYAFFSTQKQNFATKTTPKKESHNKISHLYTIQQTDNFVLKNAIVIYKSEKIAVVKQKNDRAIMIYKPPYSLQLGYSYNFTVNNIDEYNGLKEIKKISRIEKNNKVNNHKQLYLDGRTINLFDLKYQNEIIKNLRGTYKKGYLHFKNSKYSGKIKLYFNKKIQRPKDGTKLTIISGHLGIYRSKIQIILYKENDFLY